MLYNFKLKVLRTKFDFEESIRNMIHYHPYYTHLFMIENFESTPLNFFTI